MNFIEFSNQCQYVNPDISHCKRNDIECAESNCPLWTMAQRLESTRTKLKDLKTEISNSYTAPFLEYWAEEYECAMKHLDDLNIPREDEYGNKYSIVGRIDIAMGIPIKPTNKESAEDRIKRLKNDKEVRETDASLVNDWLYAVNQPVVEDVKNKIGELLEIISDNNNFTEEQCNRILMYIIRVRADDKHRHVRVEED